VSNAEFTGKAEVRINNLVGNREPQTHHRIW